PRPPPRHRQARPRPATSSRPNANAPGAPEAAQGANHAINNALNTLGRPGGAPATAITLDGAAGGAGRRAVIQTGCMTRAHAAPAAAAAVISGQRVELLDKARVYACGITPYDVTHLGHSATLVWVDALARTLRFLGVEPEVCRNITDVDDVLDEAARRAGSSYDVFAAIQQFQFDQDMAALHVRSPEHEPRAHRYVAQVIRLASG